MTAVLDEPAQTAGAGVPRVLELAKVRPNPNQPRKHFDERDMAELVASIQDMGVLTAITVRVDPDDPAGYLIVGGERRWRAANKAGLTEIPGMIVDTDDTTAFLASVSENVTRADMTIMEEAAAYQELLDRGFSAEGIARRLGKRTPDIRWRIELLRLSPSCQDAVQKGTLKPSLAWYVSKLSPAGQQVVLRKYVRGDFRTEDDAVKFAKAVEQAEGETSLFGETPSYEAKQAQEKARRAAVSTIEKARGLLAEISRIAEMDPVELADAMGGQFRALDQLDAELTHVATAYRRTVRTARAAVAARQELGDIQGLSAVQGV